MQELIIYVDDNGEPTGETEEKLAAHNGTTRKHLAFSCYVFNDKGQILTTQRARSKKVWPGVWSNSFCGHPMPGEDFYQAIARRADAELGMKISSLQCIKKDYSYETPVFEGVSENEYCPLFIAKIDSDINPNSKEVEDYKWMEFDDYIDALTEDKGIEWSWWAKDQLKFVKKTPAVISLVLEGQAR
jgi:isopentenyl-diphosphate Delta-isomerase